MLRSLILILILSNVARAEWTTAKAIRKSPVEGILGDIYSHVEVNDCFEPNGDKVTSAHETCHMLDAKLAIKFNRHYAFYTLRDDVFLLDNPQVTLKQVWEAIPKEKRAPLTYDLYLGPKMQGYRMNDPFYCIEELNAYLNGCMTALELGDKNRCLDSYNRAEELWQYTLVAQNLSRKADFKQQADLDRFINFLYKDRLQFIYTQLHKVSWIK